jgi:hypothetical protein
MAITASMLPITDLQDAWQTVLGQLQMEMPRASYDTWVRDTKPISYEDGCLTIGTRNAYARDWLESRLASTVSRLLIGIMNRRVDVDFVVSQNEILDDDLEEVSEDEEEKKGGYEIELAASTRYEEEVKPHRVVVIPGYALRLLAQGDLSAKEMSLWLGFRQAAYFDWKKAGGGATFARNIPYQDVIGFAGMGRASFFRATTGKDSLVGGMIQRLPEMGGDGFNPHLDNATRWRVSMSPRLTRRDAAVIEMILASDIALAGTTEERIAAALQSLEDMTKRSPSDYLEMKIKTPQRAPAGVVEILRRTLGIEEDIPAALFEAAEALQNKVINAYGTVHITHHFLKEVASFLRLTQSQIWTIIVLRDRSFYDYENGVEEDFVMASQGLETLAQWSGVSVKSLKRWLEQGEFRQFVQIESVKIDEDDRSEGADRLRIFLAKGGLVFKVRKEEPPLGYLLEDDGSLIPLWTKRALGRDKVSTGSGQSEHWVGTKRVMALDKVSNAFGQSEHPLNNLYKPLLNPYKPLKPQPTNPKKKTLGKTSPLAQGGGGWDMSSLLKLNPVSDPKLKKRLLEKGDANAFVSWLLYAHSPEGEGIKSPSNLAISNIGRDPKQGAKQIYVELARFGPDRLRELLDDLNHPYQAGFFGDNNGFLRIFRKTPATKLSDLTRCLFSGT